MTPDTESTRADAALAHEVDQALWKNEVLRAMDYYEVDVRVHNRTVSLSGHIVSSTSNDRVEKAINAIPGILALHNHLVMDDQLTTEVASALGTLEHTYHCKFFTGVSHGIVALHGDVDNENIKKLAEKCAASNPHVRGVVNCLRVEGSPAQPQDEPMLQPVIGQEILFVNGVSGIVRQVVINPDNRRVTGMILAGSFTDQQQEARTMSNNLAPAPERRILIPVESIRYLTKISGFLTISSKERNRYSDFNPALYTSPAINWVPPYPYCPQDVLFLVEEQPQDEQSDGAALQAWQPEKVDESSEEPITVNDSLGG